MINNSFPTWFCAANAQYGHADPTHRPGNEAALPVDQHQLIALMAPRPVYVASAEGDLWAGAHKLLSSDSRLRRETVALSCADPKGEFLSAKLAEPAYKLLGTPGFDLDLSEYEEGPVNQPLWGPRARMGYHRRSG